MKSPFVVCGATGNVGSGIVSALLEAGEPVRVVGRERARLGPFAAKGAEPWPGDIGDAAFLSKAFEGARGAFVLIPPKFDVSNLRAHQNGISDAVVSALSRAKVPRVVALSSIGAHLSEGTGPILGLRDMEMKLGRLRDAAVACLRPAYFMENHLFGIPVIRTHGVYGSMIRPNVSFPMVATKDISDAAARLLRKDSLAGHTVHYLLGPRDLTMSEAARILGEAIGKPDLKYISFPEEETAKALAGNGFSKSIVEAFIEMYRSFNAERIRPTRERSAESTTPTTLEEFAKTHFANAYKKAA